MTGHALLAEFQAAGFQLEPLPGARLAITPASRLTPELREQIRVNKAALIAALAAGAQNEGTAVAACGWCGQALAPYLLDLSGRPALLCPSCRRWTLAGGAA